MTEPQDPDDLPPTSWRHRALMLLLAVAATVMIALTLLYQPGYAPRPLPAVPQADAARCKPGQTSGCVGGTTAIILVPASSAR